MNKFRCPIAWHARCPVFVFIVLDFLCGIFWKIFEKIDKFLFSRETGELDSVELIFSLIRKIWLKIIKKRENESWKNFKLIIA